VNGVGENSLNDRVRKFRGPKDLGHRFRTRRDTSSHFECRSGCVVEGRAESASFESELELRRQTTKGIGNRCLVASGRARPIKMSYQIDSVLDEQARCIMYRKLRLLISRRRRWDRVVDTSFAFSRLVLHFHVERYFS
jgi:hypothetical protein